MGVPLSYLSGSSSTSPACSGSRPCQGLVIPSRRAGQHVDLQSSGAADVVQVQRGYTYPLRAGFLGHGQRSVFSPNPLSTNALQCSGSLPVNSDAANFNRFVEEAWPPNAWWLQRIYLWDLSIPQPLMSNAGVDRSRTSNISSNNNGVSGPVCSCNRAAEAAILVCTRRARVQVLVRLVPIVFARHTRSSSIVFRVLFAQRVPCACSRRSVSAASTRQMAVL